MRRLSSTQRLFVNMVVAVAILLFGVWIYTSFINPEQTKAAWFDTRWLYRQAATITNSNGSELTDYQITVTIDTAYLISVSKLQSDCSDIRFTSQTGTPLPYWRVPATACNTSTTKYIVRVPSIPTSGNTIYLYYGNHSASDAQDASKVFDSGGIRGFFYANNVSVHPASEAQFDTAFVSNTLGFEGQQTYSQINCASSNCNPFDPDDDHYFSYFEGLIYAPVTGTYNIATDSDDGSDIHIDGDFNSASASAGTNVVNWYNGHGVSNGWTHTGSIALSKGYHLFTYRMEEVSGGDAFRAAWQKPGDTGYSYITSDYFFSKKYAATEPTITFGAEEISSGPVGYWSMDEGSGAILHDKSSSGNNGTISGATWEPKAACKVGKCLYFDGINDSVNFGNISTTATVSGNLTISFWMKPTNLSKGRENPVSKSYTAEFQFTLETNGALSYYHGHGTTYTSFVSPVLKQNEWQQVVLTRDTATRTLKYYVNGNLVKTATYSSTYDPVTSTAAFILGNGYAGYYQGYLDEVILYPTAKTASEVKALYSAGDAGIAAVKGASTTAGSGNTSSLNNGLVGYWKMDDGVSGDAQTLTDSSGTGNNATTNYGANTTGMDCTVTGQFGGACSFDGVDDYVSLGSPLTTNSRTYAVWVKPTATEGASRPGIIGENGGSRIDYGNGAGTSTFHAFVKLSSGSPAYKELTAQISGLNTWTHLTLTIDDTNGVARFYANGILKDTQTWDTKTQSANTHSTHYLDYVNSVAQFQGSIDEARIYNRALSPSEVSQLYAYAPGPVAYYNFNEGTGTTLNDTSGNNNNSTAFGGTPQWTQGKYGGGMYFDGSSYVRINKPIMTAGDSTIGFWLKIPVQPNNYNRILGDSTNGIDLYFTGTGTNGLFGGIGNSTGGWVMSSPNITGNTWHYISLVSTASDGDTRAYLDGKLQSTTNKTYSSITLDDLYIGSSAGGGNKMTGTLDDLRIYNYARTPGQIVSDMNGGHPLGGSPVGSQVAYYTFDEGYGSTVHDANPNKLDGTITGAIWTNDGEFGKALNFPGTANTSYITVGGDQSIFNFTSDFTVSFWLNVDPSNGTTYRSLMGKFGGGGGWDLGLQNGKVRMTLRGSSILDQGGSGGNVIPYSTWQHIVIVSTNTSIKTYQDGVLTSTVTGTWTPTSNSSPLLIGKRVSTDAGIIGKLDEVKVYAAALSADEVKIDYNHNSALSLGAVSTSSDGKTASNSAASAYCVPGDTSSCSAPVAEWTFNEGQGVSANDTSGNGNTGTLTNGPSWSQGKSGNGLSFDGSNDYVNAGSGSSLDIVPTTSDKGTIEAWIKTTGNNMWIVDTKTAGTNNAGYDLNVRTNGGLQLRIANGTAQNSINTTQAVNDGKWHYISAVIDRPNSTGYIYVDGKLDTTATGNLILSGSASPSKALTIGSYGSGGYFNGQIDEVRIFNYARSQAQIAWDYNRGKPVASYDFDECQGTTLHDLMYGNNGTITIGASGTQTTAGTCTSPTDGTGAWYNGAVGRHNNSLSFDGTDDYLLVPNNTLFNFGTGDFTLSAWIKHDGTKYAPGILSKNGSPGGFRFTLAGTHSFNLGIYDGSTWHTYYVSGNPVKDTVWQHLVVTANRTGNATFYLNGAKINAVSISDSSSANISNTSSLSIGDDTFCRSTYCGQFDGQIDDVQLYNYALTSQQVKGIYNNGAIYFGQ